ncbi:hypothetical protein HPB49_021250 [Dermacentor silvarum]|uniref:Uncharacterized protein n=1 Tax=Dermacentor silvarum TaxID=543639 RepID=A0ACB8CHK5_DERSI|nr:hypothetical protein HPB49_021250 [Dermacentor silvarum]
MEPQMQARFSLPVVVINREGLYVIIAVLGVSILGCACVLAYSLGNYGKLKKNAEEVRNYIAHRGIKATAGEHGGGEQTAAGVDAATSDAHSVTARTPVGAGSSLGAGQNTSAFVSVVRSVSDTFVVAAKQEDSCAAASETPHFDATSSGGRSGVNDSSSAGEVVTTHESSSAVAADVSWNSAGR